MSMMFLRLLITSMTLIVTTSSSVPIVDETIADVLQQDEVANSISTASSMSSMMNASDIDEVSCNHILLFFAAFNLNLFDSLLSNIFSSH